MTDNGRSWIEVNLEVLDSNIETIRRKLDGKSKLMAVVKDNAYGMGIDAVINMQKRGIDFFAVSCLDEAIELRKAGINQNILILTKTDENRIKDVFEYGLIQTIHTEGYAQRINGICLDLKIQLHCHLKVDTGMNRIGIKINRDIMELTQTISIFRYTGIIIDGIFTHLHAADEESNDGRQETLRQISLFDEVLKRLKENDIHYGITHVLNSSGFLNFKEHTYDYVRIGILLCGIGGTSDYREVLSVKSRITMVKEIAIGEMIGYGLFVNVRHNLRVATLSIGYGDGIARSLSATNFQFSLKGYRISLIGKICMDQCMVDVTGIDCDENDIVTVIGENNNIQAMADELKTIPNEILVRLNGRLPRYRIMDKHANV